MNFRNIRLENERNSHVTKRLNRLNTWNFFKVLYRENTWRVFGYSMLMLIFIAPIFVMLLYGQTQINSLQASLPLLGGFGFNTGVWGSVDDYFQYQSSVINTQTGFLTVAVSLVTSLIFCGGFAVIRDGFWTGKLSAVGVFRSMWLGIKASLGYAVVAELIMAFSLFGIISFGGWSLTAMPTWLAVICIVLLGIVMLFVVTFLLILCSVAVTYKQSVGATLRDAWLLMWLNVIPNLVHVILALLPIGLYLLTSGGMLGTLVTVFIFMFGGLYFPLVWQSYMMRTFALFHPVETKKNKQKAKSAQVGVEAPQEPAQEQAEQPDEQKGNKKK